MEQKKNQYKNINQTSQGGKYRCEFVCEAWISFGLIEGGGEWRAITVAVSAVEPTNLPWSQSLFPRQAARVFIVSISVVHIQTNRIFYRLCWKKKNPKHPVTKHGGRPSSVVNCLLPTVPGTLTPGTLGPHVQTVQGLDFSEAAQKTFCDLTETGLIINLVFSLWTCEKNSSWNFFELHFCPGTIFCCRMKFIFRKDFLKLRKKHISVGVVDYN